MRYKTIIHFENYDVDPISFEGLADLKKNENLFLNGLLQDDVFEKIPENRVVIIDRFSSLQKVGLNDMMQIVTYIVK